MEEEVKRSLLAGDFPEDSRWPDLKLAPTDAGSHRFLCLFGCLLWARVKKSPFYVMMLRRRVKLTAPELRDKGPLPASPTVDVVDQK
jgi:hypothetical protein